MKFIVTLLFVITALFLISCDDDGEFPLSWAEGVFTLTPDGTSEVCLYHYDSYGENALYMGVRASHTDSCISLGGRGGTTTTILSKDSSEMEIESSVFDASEIVIDGVVSRLTGYRINQQGVFLTLEQEGKKHTYHLYKKSDWSRYLFKEGRYEVPLSHGTFTLDLHRNYFTSYTLRIYTDSTSAFSYTLYDTKPSVVGDTLITFYFDSEKKRSRCMPPPEPVYPQIYVIDSVRYTSFLIGGNSQNLFFKATYSNPEFDTISYTTGFIEMQFISDL